MASSSHFDTKFVRLSFLFIVTIKKISYLGMILESMTVSPCCTCWLVVVLFLLLRFNICYILSKIRVFAVSVFYFLIEPYHGRV